MSTICQKKFENSHNKERHQKHCHTPTLEQLTACIAHMQNKTNGWNAHVKISMNRTTHCPYKCYINKKL